MNKTAKPQSEIECFVVRHTYILKKLNKNQSSVLYVCSDMITMAFQGIHSNKCFLKIRDMLFFFFFGGGLIQLLYYRITENNHPDRLPLKL